MIHFQNPIKRSALVLAAGLSILLTACGEKQQTGAAPAESDNTVILAKKNYVPSVGSIVTNEFTMSLVDGALKFKAGPQEMEGTMNNTESTKEIVEVLSPTKLRRTLASKDSITKMTINGQTQEPPPKSDALVGQPVILDLTDGTWTATLENGTPDDDESKALSKVAKRFNDDGDLHTYGDTPRKPGDTWEMNPEQLATLLDLDNAAGNCTVEFVDFEEFQGTRCALLKLTFNITARQNNDEANTEGDKPMTIAMQATATVHRSIPDMIDLAVNIEGTMTVDGIPQEGMTLHIEGPVRFTGKTSLKKP
jgi:hypothetical protein